jgi:hypothetical protein
MRFDQQVLLLLGNARQIAPEPPPGPPPAPATPPASSDQLQFVFHMDAVEAGQYLLRLRIDGVDSVPLDPVSETPKFDDAQRLEVT